MFSSAMAFFFSDHVVVLGVGRELGGQHLQQRQAEPAPLRVGLEGEVVLLHVAVQVVQNVNAGRWVHLLCLFSNLYV